MGYQYSVTSLLQSLHLKLQAVISSLMTTITKKTCENVKKTATITITVKKFYAKIEAPKPKWLLSE